jgi:hypothetical protein
LIGNIAHTLYTHIFDRICGTCVSLYKWKTIVYYFCAVSWIKLCTINTLHEIWITKNLNLPWMYLITRCWEECVYLGERERKWQEIGGNRSMRSFRKSQQEDYMKRWEEWGMSHTWYQKEVFSMLMRKLENVTTLSCIRR